jgi:hypothetical protein
VLSNWNDAAVLDRETGLVWERTPITETLPAASPADTSADYAAIDCMLRKVGGRYGWRLPTMQEFNSLVDDTQIPALPSGNPFVNTIGSFWSATASPSGFFYAMDFSFGVLRFRSSDEHLRVWCVRGGSGPGVQ